MALYRSGTRVLPSLGQLDIFDKAPWTSQYFQGFVDVPFLNLTPGTRDGLIHDECFGEFADALRPLEGQLNDVIAQQQRQQNEESNRRILKSVQKAIREALLILPEEEYDWFEVYSRGKGPGQQKPADVMPYAVENFDLHGKLTAESEEGSRNDGQKQFFEYSGPLHRIRILPSSCTITVGQQRELRAMCRDRSGRGVDDGLTFEWKVLEGRGVLSGTQGEIVQFAAPEDPEVCRVALIVKQYQEKELTAESIITVTDEILPEVRSSGALKKGLPGYTLTRSPGELWRSRFDAEKNVVLVNSGHRDFIYAAGQKNRKVRYICRLYIKELVLANFVELDRENLLERMIEVSLYAEEVLS